MSGTYFGSYSRKLIQDQVKLRGLRTTPEHPFYTIAGEWVEAENLTIGDLIWSLDGDYGTVEDIDLIQTQQPMYNLTVAEAHTFFVGDGDWLVHNIECKWESGRPNAVNRGVYRYINQLDGKPYFGKGDLLTRFKKHVRKNEVKPANFEYMILPLSDWANADFDDEFMMLTAERVLMYNKSYGDINLLSNNNWYLNKPQDIAKLRRFFESPPVNWPADLTPNDPGFFTSFLTKTRP